MVRHLVLDIALFIGSIFNFNQNIKLKYYDKNLSQFFITHFLKGEELKHDST